MTSILLGGIRIDDVTPEEAVKIALSAPRPLFTVTPNAVMLDACRRNPEYAALINQADLSLPDGAGILLAAKRAGTPLREKVSGIDFGEALIEAAARQRRSAFLLGGKPGVAQTAARHLCEREPHLQICGTYHGYFHKTGEENRTVLQQIRDCRPNILFVCFGFPLQEEWISRNLADLPDSVRVVAGLGGSLDVWAGNLRRAPRFLSNMGLEWAWRMMLEPRRLKDLPALFRGVFRS